MAITAKCPHCQRAIESLVWEYVPMFSPAGQTAFASKARPVSAERNELAALVSCPACHLVLSVAFQGGWGKRQTGRALGGTPSQAR